MKKFFILVPACICMYTLLPAQEWHTTGNSGTSASTNFIGTKDNVAFKIRTNNSVRMTVTSGGKVGIGTTSPKSKLDVAGSILGFDSYFGKRFPISAGTSGASYSSVGYGLTFTDTTANYRYRINNDFSSMISFRSGGFDFNTAPIGTAGNIIPYTTVMTILQNGNVGIGTITPAHKLSVAGIADITNVFASTGDFTSAHAGFIDVQGSNAGKPVARVRNTNGGSTSDGLYITAGSTSAKGSWFINFLRPDATQIGEIEQNSATSVAYFTTSDKRLKNTIGTSQKGLSDLMKIKVYDYTFKSDPQKQVLTGFMAQELYDVFPQSVSKPRNNNEPAEKNPWMVDYGSVTPLIIKAVQEQQQLIDELKKSNDDLKNQNEDQQNQIDELKTITQTLQQTLNNLIGSPASLNQKPRLEQNVPNPFNGTTTIGYYVPSTNSSTYINFYASSGTLLKSVKLDAKGSGTINVKSGELPAGVYQYALVIKGKVVDRKQMVQSK